jgi:hypothetical protein
MFRSIRGNSADTIVVGKSFRKRPLWKQTNRQDGSIKMDLGAVDCEKVSCIVLVENRVQWSPSTFGF